ncbi:MAG: pyridoxal phosphate-dependent aminotransferase [Nitriliruptorales bacterium]|nr:pyridoxal phosphate-dependent aminotransferase [Nitriliruptorales bacterium]
MSTGRLSTRAAGISASPTLAVSTKAKALRAAGEDVIGFGAGEPDFPTPAHIVAAAKAACDDPATHHYSPASGLPALREAIAAKTARDTGLSVDAKQVTVTNGGKHALYALMQVLVDTGDEVLIPSPYWVSYPEMVRLAGGTVVPVETTVDAGFRASVDQLEAARTERTKLLIFVSPSNPTGAVYPPDEIAAIGRWAAEHGIWVITDEIYEHLVYGDATMASLPVVAPEAAATTIVVNGVAKTYAMTGWRVGWSIAPADVAKAVQDHQSHATSNVANVSQVAALAAVSGPLDEVHRMREAFDRRRLLALDLLRGMPDVVVSEPMGAFYVFPDVSAYVGRTIAGRRIGSSLEFADALLDVAKVAVVPGEGFGAPGCIRISYALGDEDLEKGLTRLGNFLAG